MYDHDQRLMTGNKCAPPAWSHTIVVNQIIGERSEQEAFEIHVCIPRQKPSAEQIINVFVKKLRITHVHLITDKVIVRGTFEVKAIYVGCMPCQPVHAVEIKGVRFTIDLPICGARCGMEADASVIVEYIDYDDGCDHKVRDERYKNKYGTIKNQHINCGYDYDDCHQDHDHHHQDNWQHHQHHQSCCCPPHKKHCSREFDVSIVLRVNAKVLVGREIMVHHPAYPKIPAHPKG